MQNRKWILTSLVMTFFGIPILAQFLAVVIAMLGVGLAGIIEVCNIFITPTIYLLLNIFMLALGALMLFFSGRVGNVPEFCYSASFDEVAEKGFTLVPSRYIEFVNRDENIDFDTKMKTLQSELRDLLVAEEKSKADLLTVFKELGYEIEL